MSRKFPKKWVPSRFFQKFQILDFFLEILDFLKNQVGTQIKGNFMKNSLTNSKIYFYEYLQK